MVFPTVVCAIAGKAGFTVDVAGGELVPIWPTVGQCVVLQHIQSREVSVFDFFLCETMESFSTRHLAKLLHPEKIIEKVA